MGCFSYICPKCEKGIKSSSFSGEHCTLYLLKESKVIEQMTGQYDSYGRVFKDDGSGESYDWTVMEWGDIVDLQFDDDETSGVAAIHTRCKPKGYAPHVRSEDDPNQGWGDDDDDDDDDGVWYPGN